MKYAMIAIVAFLNVAHADPYAFAEIGVSILNPTVETWGYVESEVPTTPSTKNFAYGVGAGYGKKVFAEAHINQLGSADTSEGKIDYLVYGVRAGMRFKNVSAFGGAVKIDNSSIVNYEQNEGGWAAQVGASYAITDSISINAVRYDEDAYGIYLRLGMSTKARTPPVKAVAVNPPPSVEYVPPAIYAEAYEDAEYVILFDYDSAIIRVDQIPILESITPKTVLLVSGHASTEGTHKYNTKLALRRAQSVQQWLYQNRGFEANVFSYGENYPIIIDGKEDRALSRRVIVH
jgi:outer membrane protein OmpA-like peptidoglycan-associated protein